MKSTLMAGILISAFSTPAFTQCTDADTRKFEDFDRAWSEATRSGDRAALQGIVADNFTGITPTGAFDRKIRFTDVWVKRDGKWQVLSSQGTDVK